MIIKAFPSSMRNLASAACFAAASLSFLAGSNLTPNGPEPLPAGALREIKGAANKWKRIESQTCAVHTLSDFNGSTDPAANAMAKGVVAGCDAAASAAGTTCWQCDASPSPTHSIFTGGGSNEGNIYSATACGKLLQGTCKVVSGSPTCDGAMALRGFDCSAAQVRSEQFIIPDAPTIR